MHASALSLWPMFKEMAEAALEIGEIGLPLREALGRIGREGEQAMLITTNGVNTHRGAIWALGLLTAAAALEPRAVTLTAAKLALLNDRFAPQPLSHGAQVAQRYGARGAREEAQLGFPAVMQRGLPQLHKSRQQNVGEQNARLDALLAIMTELADTCVLYRAGTEGLHHPAPGRPSRARRRRQRQPRRASPTARTGQQLHRAECLARAAPPTCWPPACLSTASTLRERCDGNLIL